MEKITKDERLDYISGTDLKIIQSPSVFSFSIDAILLGKFVRVPIQKGAILDLCTGNGVIALLLTTRTKATIVGVELQERLIDYALRNRQLNEREEQVQFVQADLNHLPASLQKKKYDVVTCNPPYFEAGQALEKNLNEHHALARHEIACTLDDVIRVCSEQVKYKGKVAIVHRPERLADILEKMRAYRLEPKRMQLIHPKEGKPANMVLIEAIKEGQPGLETLYPITILNQSGGYSDAFKEVYIEQ
ncbi:tRNA1(Val) (adenine(37)-N6)-methyltransferase [Alkalihalobacillus sp. 1P02AB]|uniref:tRNA1(Val) (adenine(37)-N6)-methyltransferase n=1 Tax=Alkalihalobacillus sp. 1P02AB TaxID=3132260 RepID=UPI0039A60977